jgi:hypothetical protein
LVEFLIKHLMEEQGGAKNKVFDLLTPTWTPSPNMDGIVNSFISQSCYTLLSLQILSIWSCPLGQLSNESIHHEDGRCC